MDHDVDTIAWRAFDRRLQALEGAFAEADYASAASTLGALLANLPDGHAGNGLGMETIAGMSRRCARLLHDAVVRRAELLAELDELRRGQRAVRTYR